MAVNVKLNKSQIKKLLNDANNALVKTAEAIRGDVIDSQTIPFDTGTMQNESTFVDDSEKDKGKVSIVTDTPYARKLYYHPEYDFRQDRNPNAQGGWFDTYIDGQKKDFAQDTFKKLYKREAGI